MDMIPRAGWTRVSPHHAEMSFRNAPAQYVFYTHTAQTGQCHTAEECCGQLQNIQHLHMNERSEWLLDHFDSEIQGVIVTENPWFRYIGLTRGYIWAL